MNGGVDMPVGWDPETYKVECKENVDANDIQFIKGCAFRSVYLW